MRTSRAATLFAAVAVLSSLLVGPVRAQPDSDELRGQLQTAEERLQDLQMRSAIVVEDYNEATVALEEATEALAATGPQLAELATEVEALTEAAGDHARLLHKLGPTLELSSVFVGSEVAEIGARGAALRRIMDVQRADIEGLDAASTAMEALEARHAEQQAEAQERATEVAKRRERVETSLASYDAEITELEAQLVAAQTREAAQERRRRQAEEASARLEAAAETAQEQASASTGTTSSNADSTNPDSTNGGSTNGGSTNSDSSGGRSSDGSSGGDSSPPSSARQSASVAVDTALDQVGKPYQWGGSGPDSYDCSGLTSYAWRAAGVEITRTSRTQWDYTTQISRSEVRAGDLVFYSRDGTRDGIGHVAMYTGRGNEVVEAPYSGNNVRVRSDGLARDDILGYGRVWHASRLAPSPVEGPV